MTVDVRVHLDDVRLHDVASRDRDRVVAALASELTRLFATHGVPDTLRRGGSAERLGAAMTVDRSATVEQYGHRVARALYRSLGGRVTT